MSEPFWILALIILWIIIHIFMVKSHFKKLDAVEYYVQKIEKHFKDLVSNLKEIVKSKKKPK